MSKRAKILLSIEDLDWLFETHLKHCEDLEYLRTNAKAAILVGNEDCPELIELYNRNPYLGDKPLYVEKLDNER